jgi:hypothetical protein
MKWFAHIDREFALHNDPLLLPRVKRGDIDRIINDLDAILQRVAKNLKLPVEDYINIVIIGDAEDLIKALD